MGFYSSETEVLQVFQKPLPASRHNRSILNPLASDDKQILRVVVERPKGSRNKFAFDSDKHLFELKKVSPTGIIPNHASWLILSRSSMVIHECHSHLTLAAL
ncbi:MAG: hypothetical protein DMG84_18165 [Acidobacteria bacterium]|nr:MAG: hypothetical protein DMG84_18165 [Acidobacteriota bacterium]